MLDKILPNDALIEGLERLGIFVAGPEGSLVESAVMRELGLDASNRGSLEDRVHPDDREAYDSLCRRSEEGAQATAEYRVSDACGRWRWLHSRLLSVRAGDGTYSIGIDEDVTERRSAEDSSRVDLEEAEHRFDFAESMRAVELVASASPDLGSTIAAVLKQARLSIPFASASVFATGGPELKLVGSYPESAQDAEKAPIRDSACLEEAIETRSPIIRREGELEWIDVPLVFKGQVLGVLRFDLEAGEAKERDFAWPAMIFGDMLAIKLDGEAKRKELVRQASTDPLTGLLTRRSFSEIASKQLAMLARRGEPVAIILADIDHFKSFNDRYGHLQGDTVLRGVALCIKEGLRQEDVICRFGGEEIVALLPGENEATALEVAERLRARLEGERFVGIEERVTASFGVAVCSDSAIAELDRLVELADRAMYLAKEKGRNNVVLDT
jgi:diguanylate cyclase (GGDEF)-like protein